MLNPRGMHVASGLLRRLGGSALTRRPAPVSLLARALAGGPGGGGRGGRRNLSPQQEKWEKIDKDLEEEIFRRMQGPERQLRAPTPPPPTTHHETWVPASRVSSDVAENALSFRTRFYIDATGGMPGQNKVRLVVKLAKLGLSEAEERRLVAVASRGNNYDPKARELKMSCGLHHEIGRNKEELRRTLGRLVLDARQNAESHAAAADEDLPLFQRSRPWLKDTKYYRGRPRYWLLHRRG